MGLRQTRVAEFSSSEEPLNSQCPLGNDEAEKAPDLSLLLPPPPKTKAARHVSIFPTE